MAAIFSDSDLNALADAEAARITHLSLHEANPGNTGTSEAVGGTPAYSRMAVVFNGAGTVGPLGSTIQPATVGKAWSTQVIFDVDAASYTHFGGWNAAVAGSFRGGNVLSTAQVANGQAQIKLSIAVGPVAGA